MRRKIPSVEALIAFEAAARHLSFTRSADELFLTQSAVGRQVAGLEEYVGLPLFNRFKKRLSLTEVGSHYAERIRNHLDAIERDTLDAMAYKNSGGVVELAVIPTFATRWLIPRLPEFYKRYDRIVVNLTTRAEPFLFTDARFDAAIHVGEPTWPGAVSTYLFGEEITAVCSPRLLAGGTPLEPSDLASFTLLHQSARPDAWRQYLASAGIHDVDCMQGQRYELFSMLVEAARAGLGVALVPRFLVAEELERGELISPVQMTVSSTRGYYLVYPKTRQVSTSLKAFNDWLLCAVQSYLEEHGR